MVVVGVAVVVLLGGWFDVGRGGLQVVTGPLDGSVVPELHVVVVVDI